MSPLANESPQVFFRNFISQLSDKTKPSLDSRKHIWPKFRQVAYHTPHTPHPINRVVYNGTKIGSPRLMHVLRKRKGSSMTVASKVTCHCGTERAPHWKDQARTNLAENWVQQRAGVMVEEWVDGVGCGSHDSLRLSYAQPLVLILKSTIPKCLCLWYFELDSPTYPLLRLWS